jgi:hypothetical protein
MSSAVCLDSLIDDAVAQLPFARRRAYQRLLNRPKYRAEVVDHVAENMLDEPCCAAVVPMLNSQEFDGKMMMAVDPENLQKILDFIATILPMILKLFFGV